MLQLGALVLAVAVSVAALCSPVHALTAREILDEATRRARRAGMKRSDIAAAVKAVRAAR